MGKLLRFRSKIYISKPKKIVMLSLMVRALVLTGSCDKCLSEGVLCKINILCTEVGSVMVPCWRASATLNSLYHCRVKI